MRTSGLLLHPTSLPGPEGIGTLGEEARDFVDFLSASGTRWWQLLPLSPPGPHDSPYMARSAMAGNELLIDVRTLVAQGLVPRTALAPLAALGQRTIDFAALSGQKLLLLEQAYSTFASKASSSAQASFRAFRERSASWLDDYALFVALSEAHEGKSWVDWPTALREREPDELARAKKELLEAVERTIFAQYLFSEQWEALHQYAAARSVSMLGDTPIFVAHDSADVWAHPELFFLDSAGQPLAVAGVPPDYFSETGQLWGNPLYRWDRMAQDGYAWWVARARRALELVDRLRIDHFRGFAQYWEVPAGAETAIGGRWVDGPGQALFEALRKELGGIPFVAEDLGIITPDVEELRDGLGLPGMAILQFAFGGDPANAYLPHNYAHSRRVVYTGTHDNDTTAGWYASLDPGAAHHVRTYLSTDGRDIARSLVRLAWSSCAELAIAPVQDLLGLGSSARMNTPGEAEGNWAWRLAPGSLRPDHAHWLRDLNALYNRLYRPAATSDKAASKIGR